MTSTCCCCFDEDTIEYISCANEHIICKECTENGVSSAIGNISHFKCPNGDCRIIIDESQINKIVNNDLRKAYERNTSHLFTRGIENLHMCAVCDYAVILENNEPMFYCIPCDKMYCICKKDLHPGTPCNDDLYAEAEALTNAYVLRCRCGNNIVKADACNHMTCVCGHKMCWYCKRDGWHDNTGCPLFGEPPEIQDAAVTSAAIAARLAASDPTVAARQAREERERIANETINQIANSKATIDRLERERFEREQLELARIEQERIERMRIEHERIKLERRQLLNIRSKEILERIKLEIKRTNKELRLEKLHIIRCQQFKLEQLRPNTKPNIKYHSYTQTLSTDHMSLFIEACLVNDVHRLKKILKEHTINTTIGFYPAVKSNNIDAVKHLLKYESTDIAYNDHEALRYAIKHDYVEIAKLIINSSKLQLNKKLFKTFKPLIEKYERDLINLYMIERLLCIAA